MFATKNRDFLQEKDTPPTNKIFFYRFWY